MSTYSPELPVSMRGTKAPVKMWIPEHEVESQALQQVRNVADLPWVDRVAVMPDVHMGVGASIGTVIAMRDAVSPATCGVDLGCGMVAVQTNINLSDLPDSLLSLRLGIESRIPVGFNAHDGAAKLPRGNERLVMDLAKHFDQFSSLRAEKIADREGKAVAQCGTLGGGNHFAELCVDEHERVWLTLHSGSRNIGKELAERHINLAKTLDHNATLPDKNLAVFLANTAEMAAYVYDLKWAQDYAALNRRVMLALFVDIVRQHFPSLELGEAINCHHNYVSWEQYGQGSERREFVVTRKGAIAAYAGQLGMIPGSMGTGSFIVRGLGNDAGLNSASHGAGRKMSRAAAKRAFTTADLASQTAGVECRKDAGVIDEAPGAYKDLAQVIAYQAEGASPLIEVVERLTTLLCVKG